MIGQRLIAEVPIAKRKSGIRWLILEFDQETGGWTLFMHQTRQQPSDFDSWYRSREEAEVMQKLSGVFND
jgi:hypothetical protein